MSLHSDELPLTSLGAIYKGNNRCTFSVWAPLKKKVALVLAHKPKEFFSMTADENGLWSVTLDNVEPLTRYFFRIDEEKILPDPASRFQPEGVHGPSAVVNQGFPWSDSDWKGIALKEMIIYELHVGTFNKSGTFEGVKTKLPYLKDLGINAIELMPRANFQVSEIGGMMGCFPSQFRIRTADPMVLKR